MKRLRIYIDTSVVGGCFDAKFQAPSNALFEMARRGEIGLLVSETLVEELAAAPEEVQEVLSSVHPDNVEEVSCQQEAQTLSEAYLAAGVVSASSKNDARYVAIATVARADLIVSWNFRHIVHIEKIRGFNSVNMRQGYAPIDIRSPLEVV